MLRSVQSPAMQQSSSHPALASSCQHSAPHTPRTQWPPGRQGQVPRSHPSGALTPGGDLTRRFEELLVNCFNQLQLYHTQHEHAMKDLEDRLTTALSMISREGRTALAVRAPTSRPSPATKQVTSVDGLSVEVLQDLLQQELRSELQPLLELRRDVGAMKRALSNDSELPAASAAARTPGCSRDREAGASHEELARMVEASAARVVQESCAELRAEVRELRSEARKAGGLGLRKAGTKGSGFSSPYKHPSGEACGHPELHDGRSFGSPETHTSQPRRRSIVGLNDQSTKPSRGFVVNISRLNTMVQTLGILHEFIKNTAIAAMTLVALGGDRQMISTLIFLWGIAMIYMDHEDRWDRLDVNDLMSEMRFWPHYPEETHLGQQCNRLLRCLSGKTRRSIYIMRWFQWTELILAVGAWAVVVYAWRNDVGPTEDIQEAIDGCGQKIAQMGDYFCHMQTINDASDQCLRVFKNISEPAYEVIPGKNPLNFFNIKETGERFIKFLVALLVDDPEELEQLGMQVMVYSLMWCFHTMFNLLYSYECRQSMPVNRKTNQAWDIEADGVPLRFKIFGLPSMWFVTNEDYARLLAYVNALRPTPVYVIYPEELAMILLHSSDDDLRHEVAETLKRAMFFELASTVTFKDDRADSKDIGRKRGTHSLFDEVNNFMRGIVKKPEVGAALNLDLWIFQCWYETSMNVCQQKRKARADGKQVNVGVYMPMDAEFLPDVFGGDRHTERQLARAASRGIKDDDHLDEFEDMPAPTAVLFSPFNSPPKRHQDHAHRDAGPAAYAVEADVKDSDIVLNTNPPWA